MAKGINKNSIIISKEDIQKEGGIVILSLREYKKLCERAVPIYYLKGKEAEKLDKLVKEGLKEYKKGRTISAPSLKEALKIYESRKKNKKN
jgi:hypothetical protein